MSFKQFSDKDGNALFICPDQVAVVAEDKTVLNAGDMTGIYTVNGSYYAVQGAVADIVAALTAADAPP